MINRFFVDYVLITPKYLAFRDMLQEVVQLLQKQSSRVASCGVDHKGKGMKRRNMAPSCSDLLDVNLLGLSTIWVLVFLTCSVLSLIWYGYFYCICALHIIVNNDRLQRVLRAITKNG